MIGGRFSHESHEEKADAHLGKGFQSAAKERFLENVCTK